MQPLPHRRIFEKITILHQADFVRAFGSTAVLDYPTLPTAHLHSKRAGCDSVSSASRKLLRPIHTSR